MSVNVKSTGSGRNDGSGFLEGLPLTRYPYKGRLQFLNIFYCEFDRLRQDSTGHVSEWILFDIDEETFNQEFLHSSDREITKSWASFSASENLMLIKITTPEHSHAATALNNELTFALEAMGLHRAIQTFSGTAVRGDKKGKRGDHGWGPLRPPRGRSRKWPAVALEVAVSESQGKLNSDVRFWLRESQGDTKIVLTLRVNRTVPAITIEKWELQNDRVHRSQHVAISKGGNDQVIVRGDSLVIEFHKLFCRPPTVPQETDIRLDQQSLQAVAVSIWCVQEF